MRLDMHSLIENAFEAFQYSKTPNWNRQPFDLALAAYPMIEELRYCLDWVSYGDHGVLSDIGSVIKTDPAFTKQLISDVLTVTVAECIMVDQHPSPKTYINVMRQYIKIVLTKHFKGSPQLDESTINEEGVKYLDEKLSVANEFFEVLDKHDYETAVLSFTDFIRKSNKEKMNAIMEEGAVTGKLMLEVDDDISIDDMDDHELNFFEDNTVEDIVSQRELDDTISPRDPDVNRVVEEERLEEERRLERQANALRYEQKENRRRLSLAKAYERGQRSVGSE